MDGQIFGFYDPGSLLLDKAYVKKGRLTNAPPSKLSTWFIYDPSARLMKSFVCKLCSERGNRLEHLQNDDVVVF